ncbi:MAG TPA: FtsQ-type POTRA domain-containing protein [Balneolales bacterium]|nr:FtsQ-type POTRA domain-containing protein [Balneolales bacterium]
MSNIDDLFENQPSGSSENRKNEEKFDKIDPSIEDGTNQNDEKVDESLQNDQRSIKGRYVLLAVLVVIGVVIIGYNASKSVIIQKVTVDGESFTNPQSIIRKARVPLNMAPDSIDFLKIIHNVERLPYIEQAYVRVIPPKTLHIHVTERKPIAMLVNGSHKIYVDSCGVKLPIIEGKAEDVPLVYGFNANNNGDTVKTKSFREVSHFLTDVQKNKLANLTISEVTYTSKDGVVALSQDNGVKLIFGKKDYNERLTYWDAFYRQVVPQKGIDRFAYVDLRYKGQIVTHEL